MSLRLPSEIVVADVLPTLRVMLARELEARGLTQEEIAEHLGITQAAVSKYVTGEERLEERISEHPRTARTVERIADGLADGSMDGYDALAAVLELIRAFEDRGPICELHEEAMPELRGLGCDLCVRGTDEAIRAEREALASVRKAARLLATAPGVAAFVPNVGSNVGTALPGATDASDVAAVPGRIYAIGGRVDVPANPSLAPRNTSRRSCSRRWLLTRTVGARSTSQPTTRFWRPPAIAGSTHSSSTPTTRTAANASRSTSPSGAGHPESSSTGAPSASNR